MISYVTAKIEIRATHYWTGAPKPREYLASRHAHVFKIKVKARVNHQDREIEFHDLRDVLDTVVTSLLKYRIDGPPTFGERSCEQIGSEILNALPMATIVIVSEDGQFDAEVHREEHLPIITVCGSTKFEAEYRTAEDELERTGWAVFSVGSFPPAEGITLSEGEKEAFDALHKKKILFSEAVYVVNPGGYIGASTQSEIEYAKSLGKTLYSLEPLEE